MPSITIRDVPDGVHSELAVRAARSGRSLQEYLRAQLVQLAERPDPRELMARAAERTKRMGTALSAEKILEYRDADRK